MNKAETEIQGLHNAVRYYKEAYLGVLSNGWDSRIEPLIDELEALRGQLGYIDRSQHVCIDGWICEKHPNLGWPHKDSMYLDPEQLTECPGPGMPCRARFGYGINDYYHA